MITESNLKSITILIMQVPCCSGLTQLARQAVESSGSNIQINAAIISIQGDILQTMQID